MKKDKTEKKKGGKLKWIIIIIIVFAVIGGSADEDDEKKTATNETTTEATLPNPQQKQLLKLQLRLLLRPLRRKNLQKRITILKLHMMI